MAEIKTKRRAWIGALMATPIAVAVLVKLFFYPAIKDAYFTMSDRSLLQAPADLALIRPTQYSFLRRDIGVNEASWPGQRAQWRAMGRDVPLRQAIAVAYDGDSSRVIMPADAPANRFDFLVTFPTNQERHLQAAIRRTLGYSAHEEKRNTAILALVIQSPDLPGLKISQSRISDIPWGRVVALRVRFLVMQLEDRLQQPVVDETGLTNRYDFDWDLRPRDRATLDKMLAHLGLGLESQTAPLDVLVVQKER